MMRFFLALALAMSAAAQVEPPFSARRLVRATGEGTVSVKPDQAKIAIGVVTRAATAQEASTQNATQVEAVLTQLRLVLGATADIKTISYALTPNYQYPKDGGPPTLVGYTASNTVEVTTSDLSLIGRVIDAATQAGANNVQSLRFTLREVEPVRAQALALAAKQARAHAEAIAAGLGARLGPVLSAQEGAVARPLSLETRATPEASGGTPIETGLVEIYATVTVDVELAL